MRVRQTWTMLIGCLLAAGVTGPSLAQEGGALSQAQDLVDGLRNRVEVAPAIQADFTQTFSSEFFDETESTTGHVVLQNRKYRVETPSQVFVSDGVTTWIHDLVADQVLINDYVEDESTVSLNRFLYRSNQEYRIVGLSTVDEDGQSRFAVRLESSDPGAFFPTCTMLFRKSDRELTALSVVDLNGTTIRFDLRNLSYDSPPAHLNFTFDPSTVSEVVDLRSS